MTVLSESHPKVKQFLDELKTYLNNNDDLMASSIGTSVACCKKLADYILETQDVKSLPKEIRYLIVTAWNQYAAIHEPKKLLVIPLDMNHQNYFESGGVDERFAMIVKQLYEICKEEYLL